MKSLMFALRLMAVGLVLSVLGCSAGELADQQHDATPSPSPMASPTPTPVPTPTPEPVRSKRYTVYYHWNNTSNTNLRCVGNDLDEGNFAISDVGAVFPGNPIVTGASQTSGFYQTSEFTKIRVDIKNAATGEVLASQVHEYVDVFEDFITNVHVTYDGTEMMVAIHEPKTFVD